MAGLTPRFIDAGSGDDVVTGAVGGGLAPKLIDVRGLSIRGSAAVHDALDDQLPIRQVSPSIFRWTRKHALGQRPLSIRKHLKSR